MFFAVVMTLLATACGAGPDPAAEGGVITAQPLAYSLTGNLNLRYHTEMDTEMTTSFGDAFQSLDPSLSSDMVTKMEMSFDSAYRIESGSEPGTYQVTMTLDGMELKSGSVDAGSESFDFADLPQGQLDAALDSQLTEVVYVIDEKGEILSMELAGLSIDVSALLGGTSSGGISSGQMFGPQLPDHDVQIGDSWTTTTEQAFGDMDPIVTEQTHTILRSDERNGHDTWLIRTEAITGAYTITWDDILAMAEALGGLETMGIDDSLSSSYQMSMRSAPTSTTTITWFDPVGGVVVATDVTTNMVMTIEMSRLPGLPGSVTMGIDGYTHLLMELVP